MGKSQHTHTAASRHLALFTTCPPTHTHECINSQPHPLSRTYHKTHLQLSATASNVCATRHGGTPRAAGPQGELFMNSLQSPIIISTAQRRRHHHHHASSLPNQVLLHAAKHPHAEVCGLLLGPAEVSLGIESETPPKCLHCSTSLPIFSFPSHPTTTTTTTTPLEHFHH